jgi:hypothetical protein
MVEENRDKQIQAVAVAVASIPVEILPKVETVDREL